MSDPPPSKRRRNEDNGNTASQNGKSAAEQRGATFVYTGQPIEEISKNITNLAVDPSVRRIESKAFKNCRLLRSITIPATVESVGFEAFMWCVSLTVVQLHEGLKVIGPAAFLNCTSLMEVELPNGITEISNNTFGNCKTLCTVSLPITVERIGIEAFSGCISLVDISLPKHLKRIGNRAFKECTGLSSVVLPSSLEFVGRKAFFCCKNLLSVEIPPKQGLKLSGLYCFGGARSLVNVSLPSQIPGRVFFGSGIRMEKCDLLKERFSNLPVHRLCYKSSRPVARDQIIRIIDSSNTFGNIILSSSLKDAFEMTPFHILATSASLNHEILECLLDRYPMNILGYKDSYGNTMMDYLLKHTSPRAVPLLQTVLRLAVVNTISTWHPQGTYGTNLSMLVDSVPLNSDMDMRRQCVKDFFGHVGYCIQIESTSVMELSVWKTRIESMKESNNDEKMKDVDRRESCRYQSGAGVVIENVFGFLWNGEPRSDTALTLFPLCASTSVEKKD